MKRKIAAILSADVAGYSRLVAEDEEETLRRLAAYQGVFQEHVSRAGGRIFNTAGDAVLAEFPSAVDAMRAAIDVQESLRTRNRAYPASRQMAFRMGLTIGDVVDKDGDLLGDGVNIAARLQTLAKPGGICISKSMHDAVANKLSVRYVDIGAHQLKNIPSPVNAFNVVLDDADEKTAPKPPQPSGFAVSMPLAVAAAMLIGASVAAISTGIISFGGKETPNEVAAPKPAEPTGPAGLPLPPAEAIKTETAAPDATKAPEPEPAPVTKPEPAPAAPAPVEVKTETKPADAGAPKTTETNVATLPPDRSADTAAMDRLRPRRWSECKGDDTDVALTACRALISDSGTSGADLALAHRQLAYALRKKGDVNGAIAAFTDSIEISDSTEAHNDRGIAYLLSGNTDKAIEDYDKAIALDGNNGDAYNNRGWTYFKLGKFREALADADRAVRLLGDKAYVWDTRGHIHEALGDRRNATTDFEKALSLEPDLGSSKAGLKRVRGS